MDGQLMPHSWLANQPGWRRVGLWLPFGLLVLLAVFTTMAERGPKMYVDLGLTGLAALWIAGLFVLPAGWRRQPVCAVFLAGLVAIMAVLVLRAPWFGFFTPAGYVFAFGLLGWPLRLFGVAAVAAVAGTAQGSGIDLDTTVGLTGFLAVLALNIVAMCGAALLYRSHDVQSAQRKRALEEAREANHRLEAMLAENAVLHRQLLARAREAGVHDERQRMAREIHDTLAQGLTGIVTQLQAAEQAGDRAGWQRHLDAATGLARDSLSEARRSVHALRPEPLDSGLGEAVAEVADRWSALHGLAVEVTTTGDPRPLDHDAEFALLRAAQEALANVAKHAGASRVGVTLSYMEREVALDVRDDGAGFAPALDDTNDPGGGGFGLVAMRERIEGVSGTLQVESEPGGGTAVSACVPARMRP